LDGGTYLCSASCRSRKHLVNFFSQLSMMT
jgi:hypothetical protein